MRAEQEMLNLIVDTARNDDRIRAVILNGSRANPNAPRDMFQDYDVVYIVTDPRPFRKNFEWIKRFGELMIPQLPDEMRDPPAADDEGFAYLMQFADGNRIDLGIYPLAQLDERIKDSLTWCSWTRTGSSRRFRQRTGAAIFPNRQGVLRLLQRVLVVLPLRRQGIVAA